TGRRHGGHTAQRGRAKPDRAPGAGWNAAGPGSIAPRHLPLRPLHRSAGVRRGHVLPTRQRSLASTRSITPAIAAAPAATRHPRPSASPHGKHPRLRRELTPLRAGDTAVFPCPAPPVTIYPILAEAELPITG